MANPSTAATILNAIATVGGPILSSIFGASGRESQLTPQQEQLQQQLIQGLGGSGPLGLLGQFNFDNFQRDVGDPLRQQFQQRTVPGIQQRFAGLGQLRGTSSGDTITRAGADLEGQIANLGFQGQQNSLDRILRGAGLALGTGTQQRDPGRASSLFAGIGQGAAQNFDLQQTIESLLNLFGSGEQGLSGTTGRSVGGARAATIGGAPRI